MQKKKWEEQAKELKLKYNETLEKYKKSPEYKKNILLILLNGNKKAKTKPLK